MIRRELKTLCLTCQGQGQLVIPRARLDRSKKITVGAETAECWFCNGEGWLRHAVAKG